MRKIGTIRAYVDYNDYTKTHYYENFDIIDELPKINDEYFSDKIIKIEEVDLDCEQSGDNVYNYDYYKLTLKYEDYGDAYTMYVCIEKEKGEYND